MTEGGRALRIQVLIGFMCAALVVYFILLGRIAMAFITSGEAAAIGLGVALLALPLIGIWVMVSTLRAGLAHQRLARTARERGMELDVSGLPRMASGRIEREAADALFQSVARKWRPSRTTGCAGTGWPERMTMPATAAGPARPCARPSNGGTE